MTIQIDSREKERAIGKILHEFERQSVKHFISKLPVGDYMSLDNARLVIDRKQNLSELCSNVSGIPLKDGRGRMKRYADGAPMTPVERFRRELERAREYGVRLVILCEHGGSVTRLEDVARWVNPRLKESPLAVSGERLYRILYSLGKTYGAEFRFCSKARTGAEIIRILSDEG